MSFECPNCNEMKPTWHQRIHHNTERYEIICKDCFADLYPERVVVVWGKYEDRPDGE